MLKRAPSPKLNFPRHESNNNISQKMSVADGMPPPPQHNTNEINLFWITCSTHINTTFIFDLNNTNVQKGQHCHNKKKSGSRMVNLQIIIHIYNKNIEGKSCSTSNV